MLAIFKKFERLIIIILGVILGIFIVFSVFELIILTYTELTTKNASQNGVILSLSEIKNFLNSFFIVLIAFELFETIRVYLKDSVFHAEYIVLVGVIALARKIVLLDFDVIDTNTLIGIGVLLIALSVSYFLLKKSNLLDEK